MEVVQVTKDRHFLNIVKTCFALCRRHFTSKMKALRFESASSVSSSDHTFYLRGVQEFVPKLEEDLHKGQCGRIAVIGGSLEYTGAPYFAAISSLKLGADIVHVFCCKEAGQAIKSYSPELIVHPILNSGDAVSKIQSWVNRFHAIVIGPGLGRDEGVLNNVKSIIKYCKTNMKPPPPLIIDADGLRLITEDLNIIKDYGGPVILTPNAAEFSNLKAKFAECSPAKIASSLNVLLLQKGIKDVITNGMSQQGESQFGFDEDVIVCDVPGSNRRCGGQGDVLSGCIATFVAWLEIESSYSKKKDSADKDDKSSGTLEGRSALSRYSLAVYGACVITRTCSRLAFGQSGRGMTASDMVSNIPYAFKLNFGV